jgi:hypothetical protein
MNAPKQISPCKRQSGGWTATMATKQGRTVEVFIPEKE